MVVANDDLVPSTILDLKTRWFKARQAVVSNEEAFLKNIHLLNDFEYEQILKKIFLNSRNLGQGYQKRYGISWELTDIQKHFSALDVSCLHGQWLVKNKALVLSRSGCAYANLNSQSPHRICQYWREAIDGLVMGLCEQERFARHKCVTIDDSNFENMLDKNESRENTLCEDVFYIEEEKKMYQWGPLPSQMLPQLVQLQEKFHNLKVKLTFLGLSEKQLFYRLESGEVNSCGTAGTLFKDLLVKNIEKIFPGLILKDASPVAVIAETNH